MGSGTYMGYHLSFIKGHFWDIPRMSRFALIWLPILITSMPTALPVSSLATEGVLWFKDLSKPDSYGVLPVLLAGTNLVNIEVRCYFLEALYFLSY